MEGILLASGLLATQFSPSSLLATMLVSKFKLTKFHASHCKAVEAGDGLSSSSMNNGREKATPFSVVGH